MQADRKTPCTTEAHKVSWLVEKRCACPAAGLGLAETHFRLTSSNSGLRSEATTTTAAPITGIRRRKLGPASKLHFDCQDDHPCDQLIGLAAAADLRCRLGGDLDDYGAADDGATIALKLSNTSTSRERPPALSQLFIRHSRIYESAS